MADYKGTGPKSEVETPGKFKGELPGKSSAAYGGLGASSGGKGGSYRDDEAGHPAGHHGKAGHVGHPRGNRMSYGGCPKCGTSPCTCP